MSTNSKIIYSQMQMRVIEEGNEHHTYRPAYIRTYGEKGHEVGGNSINLRLHN